MRLLNVDTLQLHEFFLVKPPKYVIASHRWTDAETTFQELSKEAPDTSTAGYKKIQSFANFVKQGLPSIHWLWIDTCCIDKQSSAELSEAVSSMFEWYHNAVMCLIYLDDVEARDDRSAFERSTWFRRNWTLQELIAQSNVVFMTKAWEVIGSIGEATHDKEVPYFGPPLASWVSAASRIHDVVHNEVRKIKDFTADGVPTWTRERLINDEEDIADVFLRIFDVSTPALFGGESQSSRRRLLQSAARLGADDESALRENLDRRQKVIHWLSAPDPWLNHVAARHIYEPGTNSSVLQSDKYQRWKAGVSKHLWLQGRPGCGKTILCSSVIEDIQAHCEGNPKITFGFFYFSSSHIAKQTYDGLLRSLLTQLVCADPGLDEMYRLYRNAAPNMLDVHALFEAFLRLLGSFDTFYLIIDALDELSGEVDGASEAILHYLRQVAARAPNVQLFMTSCPRPFIEQMMTLIAAEEIAVADVVAEKDISTYILSQISRTPELQWLDSLSKDSVAALMSKKAHGGFLWVVLQLWQLKRLRTKTLGTVMRALELAPDSLADTYERILSRIDPEKASVWLQWVTYASVPLSLDELSEAIKVEFGNESPDTNHQRSVEELVDVFGGMITITDGDEVDSDHLVVEMMDSRFETDFRAEQHGSKRTRKTVRLLHTSTKEYLEFRHNPGSSARNFPFAESEVHRHLAQYCVAYILEYSSSEEKTGTAKDLETFPLLKYAAYSWFYHSARKTSQDFDLELRLLCSGNYRRHWLHVFQPDQPRASPFNLSRDAASPLYYASNLELFNLVRALLIRKEDPNACGGRYGNALQVASERGNLEIVKVLIENGAKINVQEGEFGSALQAASARGHETIVRVLIDAGADANACGGTFGHALQAAAFADHERIVRLLLDNGADVNAQGGSYGSALHVACLKGHMMITKMLLHHDADIHCQDRTYGNALQAAARGGHKDIVQLLAEAGAEINATGVLGSTALQIASWYGLKGTVDILLQAGAEVNAVGGQYGNALVAASCKGHQEVVEMLINAGADIESGPDSALHVACLEGHREIVRLLINSRVEIDRLVGNRSALDIAKDRGDEDLVELLITAGARRSPISQHAESDELVGPMELLQAEAATLARPVLPKEFEQPLRTFTMTSSHTDSDSVFSRARRSIKSESTVPSRGMVDDNFESSPKKSLQQRGFVDISQPLDGELFNYSDRTEIISDLETLRPTVADAERQKSRRASTSGNVDQRRDTNQTATFTRSGDTPQAAKTPLVLRLGQEMDLVRLKSSHIVGLGDSAMYYDEISDYMRHACVLGQTYTFELSWELFSFIENELEGDIDMSHLLTITSNHGRTVAMTCVAYIEETWGSLGVQVLGQVQSWAASWVESAVSSQTPSSGRSSPSTTCVVEIHSSDLGTAESCIQLLAWLAAVFRVPEQGPPCSSDLDIKNTSGTLSISLGELRALDVSASSACWCCLVEDTCIATGFPVPVSCAAGLIIPFDIMLDLTDIIHCVDLAKLGVLDGIEPNCNVQRQTVSQKTIDEKYDPCYQWGIFYAGAGSILYPVQKASDATNTIIWHYDRSGKSSLPPQGWLQMHDETEFSEATHVMGFTPKAEIQLGTVRRIQDYPRMLPTSAPRESDSVRLTENSITLTVGRQPLQAGYGGKFKRVKGRSVSSDPELRTYDQILRDTEVSPVILYDHGLKGIAWLVSQLSVVFDMLQFRAYKEHWQDRPAFAEAHADGGAAVAQVLRRSDVANMTLYVQIDNNQQYKVKDFIKAIFIRMSNCRIEHERSIRQVLGFQRERLYGWDLLELADPPIQSYLRMAEVHRTSSRIVAEYPSWLPLARHVPVYFCDDLGQVITSEQPVCCQKVWPERKSLVASHRILRHLHQRRRDCNAFHLECGLVWEPPRPGPAFCEHQRCPSHESEATARGKFMEGIQTFQDQHNCQMSTQCIQLCDDGASVFGPKETLFTKLNDVADRITPHHSGWLD